MLGSILTHVQMEYLMENSKYFYRLAYRNDRKKRIQNVNFSPRYFTGKERDSETGFSYFGARYYDSDILTGWLSVDPMADKYPSLSPYAYCAWNPIKLVDPDGKEGIVVSGSPGKHKNKLHFLVNGLDRAVKAKNKLRKEKL